MSYSFKRKNRSSYSNQEKLELAELVQEMKEEYDLEVEKNKGKTKYDYKRKRHVPIKPSTASPKPYDSYMEISGMLKAMMLNLFAL